eukprot:CAMPEP_0185022268 /NCGR_PEP_ID=MMETSP1103-20130426/4986_1 /TAXON_ID=36769 /ORGANISM="Paraphysomonas bandaiensis, Strain Caron Lab Isolate" /LENGTH=250 /DNA_ID=CAMNT_0027554261 /DNA_START=5 /DNA_END=757 /DNA_ORIENTATION=-
MSSRRPRTQSTPLIIPPLGFFIAEPSLYRVWDPLLPEHIPFLKRLKLGAIVAVSSSPLGDTVISFAENEGLSTHCIISEEESPFMSSVSLSEDWMKRALELLLTLGEDPVLIIGSPETAIDACIIACLRRLQQWSLTSIIGEFRMLTERSIYDIEQFIEHFDARQLVRFPRRRLPKYLEVYMDAEEEELAAIVAIHQSARSSVSLGSEDIVDGGEKVLSTFHEGEKYVRCLFRDPQLCISSPDQYNPAVR